MRCTPGTVTFGWPSRWGTVLPAFAGGILDRVSRELLSRAWAAGAGPGEGPLTIDLATMCETYGLAKEGARHHGLAREGYHPLLASRRPATC